jgi:hypothetical protein
MTNLTSLIGSIGAAAAIGIGATITMDLWNLFLKRAFGIPSLDYRLLGRWVGHLTNGTVRHARITAAPPITFECQLGWIAHYTIGITLAVGFVLVAGTAWLQRPTPIPALLFGVTTVIFPLFLLQPALGLGIASSKAPNPAKARAKSLATHVVFGLGLYLFGLIAS